MKKRHLVFILALLLNTFAVYANEVSYYVTGEIKAQPGEQAVLSINMKNDFDVCGLQMRLYLPDGITIAEELNEDGEMAPAVTPSHRKKSGHTLDVRPTSDGATQIVIYGLQTFRDNDGEIISVKLNIAEDMPLGKTSLTISHIAFSDLQAVSYEQDPFDVPVTIYRTYNISASSANEAMGKVSIVGGGEQVESGANVTVTATPVEGYEFVNWTVGDKVKSTENPYTFTATENVALVGNFKAKKYDVTFDVDGKKTTTAADFGSVITAPENPTKEGYTFAGWDPEFVEGATVPVGGITYTATWTINKYTITFNSNGGSEVASITQDYGTNITAPEDPTREGYTFDGWDTEIPSTMPAKDMTITAKWKINSYTVKFVSDDKVLSEKTLEYGSVITAPEDPVKEGHTFSGWDPEFVEGTTVPAKDVTYTAKWTINKYTITFDSNGGSEVASITQDYGTKITAPEDPTREGYTFAGWDTEIPSTMPAKNMTITAKWTVNKYTVKFVSDGKVLSEETLEYGSVITAPKNPTKEGYGFSGWDPEFVEGTTVPANDVTYTAVWTVNRYTITFDSNGGSKVDPITQDYGTKITAPKDPTREGYTFAGWDTEIPSTMPAKDMTITAKWTVNSYTVKFVSDGKVLSEEKLEYGSVITAPEDPVKEGHTFIGWDPEFVDGATVPAKDVAYTAVWEINSYKLTYYLNGEEVLSLDVVYGDVIEPFEPEVADGHVFNGWQETVPETMPAHDVDIHGTTSQVSSIARILADADGKVSVYSLNGVLLMRDATLESISKLPRGIYIINGKKFMKGN